MREAQFFAQYMFELGQAQKHLVTAQEQQRFLEQLKLLKGKFCTKSAEEILK